MYGDDGDGDDSSAIFYFRVDGILRTYTDVSGASGQATDIDYQDGEWHTLVFQVIRNNNTNSANNITMKLWLDDWDMSEEPELSRTATSSDFGSQFHHIAMFSNWSAETPSSSIMVAVDNFEVWDGEPDSDSTPPSITAITISELRR